MKQLQTRCTLLGSALFLLLSVAVSCIKLADNSTRQTNAVKPIDLTSRIIRPTELKRLARQDNIKISKKTRQTSDASTGGQGDAAKKDVSLLSISNSKKFQARMMRSTDEQQQRQYSSSSSSAAAAAVDNNWQTNQSMEPTFVDQEQGDDMVALASDLDNQQVSMPEQQVKILPHINRTFSSEFKKFQQQKAEPGQQQQSSESTSTNQDHSKAAGHNQQQAVSSIDEYYTDEEEEEDELPAAHVRHSTTGTSEPADQKRKQQEPSPESMTRLAAINRTTSKMASQQEVGSSSWMPSTSSSVADKQPAAVANYQQQPASEQQQQQQQQVNSNANNKGNSRRPGGPDKLANLFGGRGESLGSALSKTDLAIEYLKNILKSKQTSGQSSSTPAAANFSAEQTIRLQSQPSADDNERESQHRPPVLSRLFPLPTPLTKSNSSSASGGNVSTFVGDIQQKSPLQQYPAPDLTSAGGGGGGASRLSAGDQLPGEARFSISDAKPIKMTQPQLSERPFQAPPLMSISTTTSTSTTTTRMPDEDRFLAHQSPLMPSDPIYSKLQAQMMQRQQQQQQEGNFRAQFAHELAMASVAPNLGQPVGADYLDSIDDYPRELRQQQEKHDQHLDNLSSKYHRQQQADNKPAEQPAFTKQPAQEEPQPLNAKPPTFLQSPPGQPPPPPPQQQQQQQQLSQANAGELSPAASEQHSSIKQQPQQVDPLVQFHQAAYRGQPRTVPYSSRFFQMHQQVNQAPQSSEYALGAGEHVPAMASKPSADDETTTELRSNQSSGATNKTTESTKPLPPSGLPIGQAEQQVQSVAIKQQFEGKQQQKQAASVPALPMISEKQQYKQPEEMSTMGANQPLRPSAAANQHQHHHEPAHHQHHQQNHFNQQQQPPRIEHHHHHQQHQLAPLESQPHLQRPIHHPDQHPNQQHQQQAPPHRGQPQRPPKIVSYNYFETPSESSGGESELVATNYQLGDALLSSTGGVEQVLSGPELEAIQSQFMTAEHPIVPVSNNANQLGAEGHHHQHHHQLPPSHHATGNDFYGPAGGLAGMLKTGAFSPEVLQRLQSPGKQAEEVLKELASNEEQVPAVAAQGQPNHDSQQLAPRDNNIGLGAAMQPAENQLRPPSEFELANGADSSLVEKKSNNKFTSSADYADKDKKKSLIVYLNHPKSDDVSGSKMSNSPADESIAPAVNPVVDQSGPDPFVIAKEYDGHGLSKDGKHLDIASLRGIGGADAKEAQDKDGLSVVVIGDAYKYKKIVLLISSKSGGLRFIPMVKDMKK